MQPGLSNRRVAGERTQPDRPPTVHIAAPAGPGRGPRPDGGGGGVGEGTRLRGNPAGRLLAESPRPAHVRRPGLREARRGDVAQRPVLPAGKATAVAPRRASCPLQNARRYGIMFYAAKAQNTGL